MTTLTKNGTVHTWSRDQARKFVSISSGVVAAIAGIGAILTLIFVNH